MLFKNCWCRKTCVGESTIKVILRWPEHEEQNKELEQAKNLTSFPGCQFEWKVRHIPPKYTTKQ